MAIISTFSPTSATVDLAALAHNVTQLRRFLSPGCDIMAVVKANGYGHGAGEISRTLLQHGIARLAVVSIDEGITLRQAGINAPIVVLGPLFQNQVEDLFWHRLTPVVSDVSVLPALARRAASLPSRPSSLELPAADTDRPVASVESGSL